MWLVLHRWSRVVELPLVGPLLRELAVEKLVERVQGSRAELCEFVAIEPASIGFTAVQLWEEVLSQPLDAEQIEDVVDCWLHSRSPRLERLIETRGWIGVRTPQGRVRCLLLQDRVEDLAGSSAADVRQLLSIATTEAIPYRPRARRALTLLTQPEALDELARVALDEGDAAALAACAEADVDCLGTIRRALLQILLGDWNAYDGLDFDGRQLRAGYRTAAPALRRRLLHAMQSAGRLDLLRSLTGTARSNLVPPTPEEAEELLRGLQRDGDFDALWEQASVLPLRHVGRIVSTLREAAWTPPPSAEKCFREVCELLDAGEPHALTATGGGSVLDDLRTRRIPLEAAARVVTVHPFVHWVAVAERCTRLSVFDVDTGAEVQRLERPPGGVDSAMFGTDGVLVFQDSEAAGNRPQLHALDRELIQVFASSDGRVAHLVALSNGGALGVSAEGRVEAWTVRDGAQRGRTSIHSAGRISAAASPDGSRCAVARGNQVLLLDAADLRVVARSSRAGTNAGTGTGAARGGRSRGGLQSITCCALLTGGSDVAVGTRDGSVAVLRGRGGRLVADRELVDVHRGEVLGLLPLHASSALLSWDATDLALCSWSDGRIALRVPHGLAGVGPHSLSVTHDESHLLVAGNADHLDVCDLHLLAALGGVGCQIRLGPAHLPRLDALVASAPQAASAAVRMIRTLLRLRFGGAIEIDADVDPFALRLGAADIDIDIA